MDISKQNKFCPWRGEAKRESVGEAAGGQACRMVSGSGPANPSQRLGGM